VYCVNVYLFHSILKSIACTMRKSQANSIIKRATRSGGIQMVTIYLFDIGVQRNLTHPHLATNKPPKQGHQENLGPVFQRTSLQNIYDIYEGPYKECILPVSIPLTSQLLVLCENRIQAPSSTVQPRAEA
jgi:hypothetical protein